ERLVDGVWVPDQAAMPNDRMRSLVLRRQLEGVERMTNGDTHHLATVQEALEVQTVVEAILKG
ncbi:MAG: gfo/Idh/MocA family oxidoreductase, partial [Pseudomonadota bacterium]